MARVYSATNGGKRQRCMRRGCERWEFAKGLCSPCTKEGGILVQLADTDWTVYKNKPPIAIRLVVVEEANEPYYLELKEGDYVSVLEWSPKGHPHVAIVRTQAEIIGYYSVAALKTEEQIFEEFKINEDYELVQELERREEEERQKEAQYEAKLKADMRAKAEADRAARENEAKHRRAEAERMLQEYEEQKALAEKDKREAAERKRHDLAKQRELQSIQAAQLQRDAHALREADERAFKARVNQKEAAQKAWETAEAERKDREYLDSLPAWKRAVILKKREQGKA